MCEKNKKLGFKKTFSSIKKIWVQIIGPKNLVKKKVNSPKKNFGPRINLDLEKKFGSKMFVNKAFVGLKSCDNVQTETSIFKYANWPMLQV